MRVVRKIFILTLIMAIICLSIPCANALAKSAKINSNKTLKASKVKYVKLSKKYKLTVKFVVKSSKGAEWGDSFKLQRYENKKWVSLKKKDGVAWNSMATSVSGSGTYKKTYNLADYYYEDEFTPGKYRLKANINFKNPFVLFKIKKKAPSSGKYYSKSKVELRKIKNNKVYVRLCNGSKTNKWSSRTWRLQRKENNNWVDVPKKQNVSYTADVIKVKAHAYVDYSYDLCIEYDEKQLVKGQYRIVTGYLIKNNAVSFSI